MMEFIINENYSKKVSIMYASQIINVPYVTLGSIALGPFLKIKRIFQTEYIAEWISNRIFW